MSTLAEVDRERWIAASLEREMYAWQQTRLFTMQREAAEKERVMRELYLQRHLEEAQMEAWDERLRSQEREAQSRREEKESTEMHLRRRAVRKESRELETNS